MKRPMKNVVSLFVGDLGSRLIGFLITIYLARVLEPSAFGVINIGLSVLSYLLLVASPGIQVLETRNAATSIHVDEERVNAVLSMRLFLAVVLLIILWVVVQQFVVAKETGDVIILFSASLIPLALSLDWFFQGKERFDVVTVSKLAMYVTYGICVLMLVRASVDVQLTAVAFGLGNLVTAAILMTVYYKRVGRPRLQWRPDLWRQVFVENAPIGLAQFLGQSATSLPPLVIGILLSSGNVGVYSAAMKFVFMLLLLDRIAFSLLLPVITRYFSSRRQDLPYIVTISIKTIIVIAFPLAVLGMVVAPWAIQMVYGAGYADAASVMQILMMYFVLTLLNSLYVGVLIGSGNEKRYTQAMVWGTVSFLVAIATLTGAFGIEGAAWGVVFGELSTLLLMIVQARKVVPIASTKAVVRPVFACLLMGASIILLHEMSVVPRFAVSFFVFAASLVVIGGVAKEEIRFLAERFV